MTSWAVILKPHEAFFCPVVPNPSEPEPNLNSKQQVLEILGEELARDPQIRTSIWYNRRIEVGWPRNRTDILQKIEECLRSQRILACGLHGDRAELITHRLAENAFELYTHNVRLTGSILNYLEKNVLLDQACVTSIYSLKSHGFSEEEIGVLADKNIVNETLYLLDQFRRVNACQPKECVLQLTHNRLHFNEVYGAVFALSSARFDLTAAICEELVAKPGFGSRLTWTHARLILIQGIENLFVGSMSQVDSVIRIINRLPERSHFVLNIELLHHNKTHALKIQETLIAMDQANIHPPPHFYGLLFKLIKTLYPIDLDTLRSMANHSEAIEDALIAFECLGSALTKEMLLFLIAQGEGSREIGNHASAISQLIHGAARADIQLLPEDHLLIMAHAKYADAIGGTIYYLDKDKIPLTRDDFLLLIENRGLADKLYQILKTLYYEFIWITHEDFFRLLETGGSDETVQLIKDAKRRARQRLPFG